MYHLSPPPSSRSPSLTSSSSSSDSESDSDSDDDITDGRIGETFGNPNALGVNTTNNILFCTFYFFFPSKFNSTFD